VAYEVLPWFDDILAIQGDTLAEPPAETRAQKRHRLSSQVPPPKKPKTSGVGVMGKMAEGHASMAEAIAKGSSETVSKESADSTIQGQAQEKIKTRVV
jgi:hypothetical protein